MDPERHFLGSCFLPSEFGCGDALGRSMDQKAWVTVKVTDHLTWGKTSQTWGFISSRGYPSQRGHE